MKGKQTKEILRKTKELDQTLKLCNGRKHLQKHLQNKNYLSGSTTRKKN